MFNLLYLLKLFKFKHELSEFKYLHQVQRKQKLHTKIVTREYGDKKH